MLSVQSDPGKGNWRALSLCLCKDWHSRTSNPSSSNDILFLFLHNLLKCWPSKQTNQTTIFLYELTKFKTRQNKGRRKRWFEKGREMKFCSPCLVCLKKGKDMNIMSCYEREEVSCLAVLHLTWSFCSNRRKRKNLIKGEGKWSCLLIYVCQTRRERGWKTRKSD